MEDFIHYLLIYAMIIYFLSLENHSLYLHHIIRFLDMYEHKQFKHIENDRKNYIFLYMFIIDK